MKKIKLLVVCALLLSFVVGCTSKQPQPEEPTVKTEVDFNGYVIADPEGVEYDLRQPLYLLCVDGDGYKECGIEESYIVLYSKEGKAVYMELTYKFTSEEALKAYLGEDATGMEVDGVYASDSMDSVFFAGMASFISTAEDWVNTYKAQGYMDFE